ncbi:MAG: hypothetical protein NTU58_02470 [Candidatus Nealsonbacteria bacterium]|nr:hypothetical protein [Candidatus Nealsonbacteria bacterium]
MCKVLILLRLEAVSGAVIDVKEFNKEIKKLPNVKDVFLDTLPGTEMKQLMIAVSENPTDISDAIKEIEEKGEKIENPKKFNIGEWVAQKTKDIIKEITQEETAVIDTAILESID